MAELQTVRAVIYDSHDNVLLGQRPFDSKNRAGELDLFGGRIDDGETAREAAYREAKEELGIDLAGSALHDLYVVEDTDGADTFVRHYFGVQIERFPREKMTEHIGSVLMPLIFAVSSMQFEPHREALSRLLG